MAQGSNMTKGYKGMRKGISLVEMLTAIILFGLISVISYNYYKVFYDTTFAAKQTRVYTIINQAEQLVNAYDLYQIKMGNSPTTIQQMVDQRILAKIPTMQPSISLTGWDLNLTIDTNGTGGNDNGIAFTMPINANTSDYNLSTQDKVDYCNILNNTMNTTNELNVTLSELNSTTGEYLTQVDANATFFCIKVTEDNSTLFVFMKADETN